MNTSEELQNVINNSNYSIDKRSYIYYLVDSVREHHRHLQVIHLHNEITVVTKPENESYLDIKKRNKENWKLIKIRCGNPFFCHGFIAAISSALAEQKIDITITSSFEYDLVLVQEKDLDLADKTLQKIGFRKEN